MIDCLEKLQQQQQQQHQRYVPQLQRHNLVQNALLPNLGPSSFDEVANFHGQSNAHYQQHRQASLNQSILGYPEQDSLVHLQEPNGNENQQQQAAGGSELIGYYFGSISRETAEWILKNHGNYQDGAYLLRSSGPNDDFVLSLMVIHEDKQAIQQKEQQPQDVITNLNAHVVQEILHYKIIETEDSFVALHGQVGDEKFATIDELIDKAQGVATKPRWPVLRQSLESQILPPTYWGLTIDQVRLAILIKAKQWGFPLFASPGCKSFKGNSPGSLDPASSMKMLDITANDAPLNGMNGGSLINNVTTLNNETIRTLIYKSLHEFQPWFHGKISREEAGRRIEEGTPRDGRFLVRERDNISYAMCISHKRTTKHYRIDVLPTGELAIQDGHKFTSLMALVSHYTLMSDGLWCALTEACARPIQKPTLTSTGGIAPVGPQTICANSNNLYCVPPPPPAPTSIHHPRAAQQFQALKQAQQQAHLHKAQSMDQTGSNKPAETKHNNSPNFQYQTAAAMSIKAPIKEWLQAINHKWSQLMVNKNQQSFNSFLFGSSNPLNNHCRRNNHNHHRHSGTNGRNKRCKTIARQHSCRNCGNHHRKLPVLGNDGASTGSYCPTSMQHTNLGANSHCGQAPASKPCACDCYPTRSLVGTNTNNTPFATSSLERNICTKSCCFPPGSDRSLGQQIPSLASQQLDIDPSKSILSHLPQNSGFTLDSQSFIGSPLFAVRQQQTSLQTGVSQAIGQSSSSSKSGSSSGNGKNVREERLISPAKSVSANLNNNCPYGTDIYGSQTSTALINDRQPTTSSSSSSSNRPRLQARTNPSNTLDQNMMNYGHSQNPASYQTNTSIPDVGPNQFRQQSVLLAHQCSDSRKIELSQKTRQMATPTVTRLAGQILCGQHAGPAYRYTNCQADGLRDCPHLRQINRAADDSLLQSSSTQLASDAALSKFVQFQDGQCLRTHRDTKSIQMAYLLSRQQIGKDSSRKCAQGTPCGSALHDQSSSLNSNMSNNQFGARSSRIPPTKAQQKVLTSQNFDLMDCNNEIFDFKYDPKLIKSSSIETLCGQAEEDEDLNVDGFKTNRELLMSLQSYWPCVQHSKENILMPTQTTNGIQNNSELLNPSEGTVINGELESSSPFAQAEEEALHRELYDMKKKHDLDELTTSLLAELTTSLKAQVDLKNRRSGLCTSSISAANELQKEEPKSTPIFEENIVVNPSELVDEFDVLKQ